MDMYPMDMTIKTAMSYKNHKFQTKIKSELHGSNLLLWLYRWI